LKSTLLLYYPQIIGIISTGFYLFQVVKTKYYFLTNDRLVGLQLIVLNEIKFENVRGKVMRIYKILITFYP